MAETWATQMETRERTDWFRSGAADDFGLRNEKNIFDTTSEKMYAKMVWVRHGLNLGRFCPRL